MRARAKIGAIVEIPTSKGLAYAQYSHKHDQWGALLRVLPELFANRPTNFVDLAAQKENFVTFFPLEAALRRGILRVVSHQEVPDHAKQFPLFRAAGFVDRAGRVHDWYLWDGQKEWKTGSLSAEQLALPIRALWNDTLLIERIEQGWTPASDERSQP